MTEPEVGASEKEKFDKAHDAIDDLRNRGHYDLIEATEAYGCDEIAAEIYNEIGSGEIYRFSNSKSKHEDIVVTEFDLETKHKYVFHEVYSTGKYIIDPRFSKTNSIILKEDYIQRMKELNPNDLEIKRYNNPSESEADCAY